MKNLLLSCIAVAEEKTQSTQQFLHAKGLKADFFHGGLSEVEKKDKLLAWQSNQVPIMLATNAFGMGIDKEDVGVVVHLNLPASLEYYYQEIGRAGRRKSRQSHPVVSTTRRRTRKTTIPCPTSFKTGTRKVL